MIHSTSLRATGSEMVDCTSVALAAPPLRRPSMALLTSAIWASEVCGSGPCASGICATADLSSPLLSFLLSLSLDLAAASFLPVLPAGFPALPATLVVSAEALLPPRDGLASATSVAASRLAQASAATSVDRYRVKSAFPPNPANWLRPSAPWVRRPDQPRFYSGFWRKSGIGVVPRALKAGRYPGPCDQVSDLSQSTAVFGLGPGFARGESRRPASRGFFRRRHVGRRLTGAGIPVEDAREPSTLQLALELVEETPVRAVRDDLVGSGFDRGGFAQPQRIEADRILDVEGSAALLSSGEALQLSGIAFENTNPCLKHSRSA